jgi:hypothetical protein
MKPRALAAIMACASAVCLLSSCSGGTSSAPVQSSQDSITIDSGVDLNGADITPTSVQKTRDFDCGDVNEDGKFDLSDAYALNQYLADPEKNPLSDTALDKADVHNRGNGVDMDDYNTLLEFDANIVTHLPVSTQH